MQKKGTLWKVWAAAAVLAMLLVAGCGASGTAEKKDAAQGQAEQKAPQKIVVGSDTTFAPFEFQDSKTGQYVGFDVDLIHAVAKAANLEVEYKSMAFDGLIAALQAGQIDAAISAMTITPERQKVVNFSDPYYQSGLSVAVQAKNDTIKGFADLNGKSIAVQSGTTGALKAKEVPGAKIRYFTNTDQALLELKNGGVDAVINDHPVTAYFIQQGNPDIKIVGEKLTAESYGIAVPKSKPELLEKINAGLKAIKESGEYAQIYKKWFGEEPPK